MDGAGVPVRDGLVALRSGRPTLEFLCMMASRVPEKWRYTIINAPGLRDFIKNGITGVSHAYVALIMVPADGIFTTAIARG